MTTGLWIFIAVVAVNVLGLLLDGTLALTCGYSCTITNLVRTSHPIYGCFIIAVQILGGIGLGFHFFEYSKGGV